MPRLLTATLALLMLILAACQPPTPRPDEPPVPMGRAEVA
jgi:hypothetical protein